MTEKRPQTESELVEFVRSIDVPAPSGLHRRTTEMVAARGARQAAPRRLLLALPAAGAVAAAAVVLALVLSSGGGHARMSVAAVSAATSRAATVAAPAENPRAQRELAVAVEGVPFPYWEERFGWRATGARSDRIAGRSVETVFYDDARGQRIGYAIVAGRASQPQGGTVRWREGTAYHLQRHFGRQTVAWLRHGHLCVISGNVSAGTLLRLASWDEGAQAA